MSSAFEPRASRFTASRPRPQASRSNSFRPRPRRWRRRFGRRSRAWRRSRPATSSPSPTAPAARPASAPTRPSSASSPKRRLTPAAHLTCVDATRAEVDAVMREPMRSAGVKPHRRPARRSGPPASAPAYTPYPGRLRQRRRPRRRHQAPRRCRAGRHRGVGLGLSGKAIRKARRWMPTISICSRPRSMPGRAAPSPSSFSTTTSTFRYLDRVRARGIAIPIVPGLLPVQNFKQMTRIVRRAQGRRLGAGLARRAFRRPRRRSGDPQADRRRRGGRAGVRPRRPRRHRVSFLHDEPRRPGLRGLSSAGPAACRCPGRDTSRGGGVSPFLHLPLEGGGRPPQAGRVGVIGEAGVCGFTPPRTRADARARPSPSRGG